MWAFIQEIEDIQDILNKSGRYEKVRGDTSMYQEDTRSYREISTKKPDTFSNITLLYGENKQSEYDQKSRFLKVVLPKLML